MTNETERARLARIYSGMSDEALADFAADEKSLTETARQVLQAEMSARGIDAVKKPEVVAAADEVLDVPFQPQNEPRQYSGPLAMVKRFRDLPEALVAKSILDSAQIDSFLADENVVRIDWFYSNLVGGAKLMVRPEDLEEAAKLLDEQANEANAAHSET
jgi:Putative prokaryotic signal transducing protein